MICLGALLVHRIAVGMQEQDRNGLYALRHRLLHGRANLRVVELDQHGALRVDPLHDLEAQSRLDQRLVLAEAEIVGLRPVDAADLVDVAEALGGEQCAAPRCAPGWC